MNWILIVAAVAAGIILPAQAGMNALLRQKLGDPVATALINTFVGGLLLGAAALWAGLNVPSRAAAAQAPWWAWLGGLLGALFVLAGVLLADRLGAAGFLGAVIFGQLGASILLDHFGLVGYESHPANLARLAGVGLLAGGAWLILRN